MKLAFDITPAVYGKPWPLVKRRWVKRTAYHFYVVVFWFKWCLHVAAFRKPY